MPTIWVETTAFYATCLTAPSQPHHLPDAQNLEGNARDLASHQFKNYEKKKQNPNFSWKKIIYLASDSRLYVSVLR